MLYCLGSLSDCLWENKTFIWNHIIVLYCVMISIMLKFVIANVTLRVCLFEIQYTRTHARTHATHTHTHTHTHARYHNQKYREGRGGCERGRGRMLVTGATLIHSSSSSLKSTGSYDRLNASRDVTFPDNLKELEPALLLSCLILFSRFYDKQTRTGWGQERETERQRATGRRASLCCQGNQMPLQIGSLSVS